MEYKMESVDHYRADQGEYMISTDPSLLDVDFIHNYLSQHSYWAENIPGDIVQKSIDHSLCFGIYSGKAQLGFARLVTDKATFAYLADVFIIEDFRGKGLSKWLMQVIHAHPELQMLRRWMLGTRDAHGLYEQFGWKVLNEDARKNFMQLHNPGCYKKSS
jgi:GNAT superfamily N-acetyltransferase